MSVTQLTRRFPTIVEDLAFFFKQINNVLQHKNYLITYKHTKIGNRRVKDDRKRSKSYSLKPA
jgi:hypothetical protein